jgi:2,3-dihydro-2,3-dihydroxybenzoate dehydrogenase
MSRVVLVTGASGGLGPFIVQAFAERGDTVIGVGRDRARLRKVEKLEHAVDADVTTEAGAELAVARAEQIGPIEAVVCAAGGWQGGAAEATSLAVWQSMMAQNATSAFLVAGAALRRMLPRGRGSLVFIASVAAQRGDAGAAAYAAAKAAVISVMQSIAVQGRRGGVTANAVLPGTIDTPAPAPPCHTPTSRAGCGRVKLPRPRSGSPLPLQPAPRSCCRTGIRPLRNGKRWAADLRPRRAQ